MLKVKAQSKIWNSGIEFLLCDVIGEKQAFAKNVVLEVAEEGTLVNPTFTLGLQEAQSLMDDLWQCGLRPTEGTGSAGSLAATERHLKDMQSIAMGALKKAQFIE